MFLSFTNRIQCVKVLCYKIFLPSKCDYDYYFLHFQPGGMSSPNKSGTLQTKSVTASQLAMDSPAKVNGHSNQGKNVLTKHDLHTVLSTIIFIMILLSFILIDRSLGQDKHIFRYNSLYSYF